MGACTAQLTILTVHKLVGNLCCIEYVEDPTYNSFVQHHLNRNPNGYSKERNGQPPTHSSILFLALIYFYSPRIKTKQKLALKQ